MPIRPSKLVRPSTRRTARSPSPPTDLTKRRFLTAAPLAVAASACATADRSPLVSGIPSEVEPEFVTLTSGRFGSIIPDLQPVSQLPFASSDEVHVSTAPSVPPPADRADQRVFEVELDVIESTCPLDPANGVSTEMWGYRVTGQEEVTCGVPGPVLRGRVGDLARITLHNLAGNVEPHNIDFHAVTGQGGGAEALTVAPGESATIEARLLYPGAFMYHCAFGDVPKHIAYGMYGMFIVDPVIGLPDVDHEWAVMQSEWYVTPGSDGVAVFDPDALRLEHPRYVTFNGRTDALVGDNALRMQVGERARFYFVNEGLNLDSNFHPIGSHWDTVYPEAATHSINGVIRGSQSTLVVAGGGTVAELVGQVPSTLILVDHALVRTFYKGAIGQVVVEGDPNPDIFSAGTSTAGTAPPPEAPPDENAVLMPAGGYLKTNADIAYVPLRRVVKVGTPVTFYNQDSVAHTVTSGTSDGATGTPDGIFDSGDIGVGDSWTHIFDEPGTYPYYCKPHPWMIGTVVVES